MNTLKRVLPALLMTLLVVVGCKNEEYDFDSLPDTVKSFFTIMDGDELHIDEAIQFNNESESAESYTWDFGDGTTSTERNPTKTYSNPGAYIVSLKAIGPGGTGNYSVNIAVIDPNIVIEKEKDLYFIEYGRDFLRKLPLTLGSTLETVLDVTGKEAHGMTYDEVNDKIYWCDFQSTNSGKIWRMNTDGTGLEELLTGLISPYGVALNHAEGKMYIADGAYISRANLDGTGYEREFIHVTGGLMRAVGYNSKTGLIYFYEVNDEHVYVANSNGSGVVSIIDGAYGYGLFIDEVNEKVYYDDRRQTGIMQANLDGSGKVKVVSGVTGNRGSSGMAIDYSADKLYWAETNLGNVKRANLDGSEPETLLTGLSSPRGMFIKDKE